MLHVGIRIVAGYTAGVSICARTKTHAYEGKAEVPGKAVMAGACRCSRKYSSRQSRQKVPHPAMNLNQLEEERE